MLPPHRRALIAKIAGLAMAFAPAILAGYHVAQNAVNIPVWDGWQRGELLQKQAEGTLTFRDLYAPHIEHRMVAPRIVMLALNGITGGDLRAEIGFTFFTVVVTSLCFYFLLSKMLPPGRWRYLAALAVNMAIFSPLQYQNFLWPIQVAFMLPLSCLAVCLAAVCSRLHAGFKFAICAFAATVGMHSFSHGILIWPAVFCLVLLGYGYLRGPVRTYFLCGFAVLGSALLYLYVTVDFRVASKHSYGAELDGAVPAVAGFERTLDRPDKIRKFFFASLGNPLARFFSTDSRESARDVGRGTLILFAVGLGFLVMRWRDRELRDALLPWAAMGFYAIGLAVLLSLGRSAINLDKALLPRYASLTLFLPVAVVGMGSYLLYRWVRSAREDGERPKIPGEARTAVAGALAGLAIAVWWPGWVHGARKMEQWKSARLQARATLMYLDHLKPAPERLGRIDKTLDLVGPYASFLDEKGWLRPGLIKEFGFGPFVPYEGTLSESQQRKAQIHHVAYSGGRLSVSGHAALPCDGRAADAVLLTCRENEGDEWVAVGLAELRGQSMMEMPFLDPVYNNAANFAHPDEFAKWSLGVDWPDAPEGEFEFRAWALDAEKMIAYPVSGGGRVKNEGSPVEGGAP